MPEQVNPKAPVAWQAIRLSGADALAVRASKKLRSDEALVTSLGSTILRKHLDEVPLWRGDHVAIRQLVEDFARYLYLPRVTGSEVLVQAARDGVSQLLWEQDGFAYAESYDEAAGRFRGLRAGQQISLPGDDPVGVLVKPDVARKQLDSEVPVSGPTPPGPGATPPGSTPPRPGPTPPEPKTAPKRFHGSVELDPARVGRDASVVAEEVIAHLNGLVGARVKVTLEIEAEIPSGAPENVVRTVTENGRSLKFTSSGFEKE